MELRPYRLRWLAHRLPGFDPTAQDLHLLGRTVTHLRPTRSLKTHPNVPGTTVAGGLVSGALRLGNTDLFRTHDVLSSRLGMQLPTCTQSGHVAGSENHAAIRHADGPNLQPDAVTAGSVTAIDTAAGPYRSRTDLAVIQLV